MTDNQILTIIANKRLSKQNAGLTTHWYQWDNYKFHCLICDKLFTIKQDINIFLFVDNHADSHIKECNLKAFL